MGQRRMFSNRIANSAKFLQMPAESQLLYFHLVLRADDDGIVEAYPILKNNEVHSFLHRAIDITEQKNIEKKLIENEAKYKSLIENASDYIFLVDKKNMILSINRAAEKFIGKKDSEIIGNSILNIFPKTYADEFIKSIQNVKALWYGKLELNYH